MVDGIRIWFTAVPPPETAPSPVRLGWFKLEVLPKLERHFTLTKSDKQ